ncbi:MAG: UDP-glucose 4-epimerase family protein [Burkholderiales bacterium]
MKRILVTGASGFVGRRLCAHLVHQGWRVRAAVRGAPPIPLAEGIDMHAVPDIGPETDWSGALAGIDAVVHLAARVHVMHETAMEGLREHRRVNTEGTDTLARAAARAGVQRFVYLSTIKVNGERTLDQPFTEADTPAPVDAYGQSKLEAEQRLARIADETGLACVIFRPPLMYGPGVKGNFRRLISLVRLRIPLPLAGITNARSMLCVDNMVSAIEAVLNRTQPVTATYLVSDGHDLSTPELLRKIGAAMGGMPPLFRCPRSLLLAAAGMAGKGEEARRMIESLRVDCGKLQRELQWNPPVSIDAGIAAAVQWQLQKSNPPDDTRGPGHE